MASHNDYQPARSGDCGGLERLRHKRRGDVRVSNFQEAVNAMVDGSLSCPKCGAQDILHASPTLETEQDGSLTCRQCGENVHPPKET